MNKYISKKTVVSGVKLREIRIKQNISTTRLAEMADISSATICRIEREKDTSVLYDTAVKLAKALSIEVDSFMNNNTQLLSVDAQIHSAIYDILTTNGSCTIDEVKKELENQGMNLDEHRGCNIRVALSMLQKEDPHIERLKYGHYKYIAVTDEEWNAAVEWMVRTLRKAKNFDWLREPDLEVKKLRKQINEIRWFYNRLGEELVKLGCDLSTL